MPRAGLTLAACLTIIGILLLLRAHHRPGIADTHFGSAAYFAKDPLPATKLQPPGVMISSKIVARRSAAGIPARRRGAWDGAFFSSLTHAATNDPIEIELPDGTMVSGKLTDLASRHGEVSYASGILSNPDGGRFFFQKQTVSGFAGEFVGIIEFPGRNAAYRLEPGVGGQTELVERSLDEVECRKLPRVATRRFAVTQETPPLNPGAFPDVPIPDYQNGVILLESLPGAKPVVYLDFQGGYTPMWGGIAYDPAGYGKAEIREIWQRVAEDFLPFNINVSTDLRAFQNAPDAMRQHVIITTTDTADTGAGGVSYEGSFDWSGDTPCWVFQLGEPRFCAQACSHELGHTLGLFHEGQMVNGRPSEYFYGHGDGDTSWAPIMGVGYSQNVTQWARGEYIDANNSEDQLARIVSLNNGVRYRADDAGETLATARYLDLYSDFSASAEGVIETTEDADAFRFTTSGGDVYLRADPVSLGPNLALAALLYDSTGTLLVSNNPQSTLWADIRTNLPPGTYTFDVRGSGRGEPVYVGFSSYASLGYYSITGHVENARLPDRFVVPENTPAGTVLGSLRVNNPSQDPLGYEIARGNLGNSFAIDSNGILSVANASLLDYELLATILNDQLPVQFELFVTISNFAKPTLTEMDHRVVVQVINVDEPPLLAGFTGSVIEHSPIGTPVGTVQASAPDAYSLLSYALVAGNSNGAFKIDKHSGVITVAADLTAALQNHYELAIALTDQTPGTVFSATTTATITVELPYPRGGIAYSRYPNLTGTSVADLTNGAAFPYDPALEREVTALEGDSNLEGNYGAVFRGYLLPPVTGSYTFWIASQNDSELWLSGSTNPVEMTRLAYVKADANWPAPHEWTLLPSQKSAPIALSAGYAYFIEARLKAGATPSHIAVAWESTSNGISQAVISGQYLAPSSLNYRPHPQGFTNFLHRDAIAGAYLGTVHVSDLNSNDQSSISIIAGNEQGLFTIFNNGRLTLAKELTTQPANVTSYVLLVQATDNGQPPLTGTTAVSLQVVPTNTIVVGSLQQELWTGIGAGTQVTDLTYLRSYPYQPNRLRALTSFDSGPQSIGTNYGSRIQASLIAPNTGLYTFYLSASDGAELWFTNSAFGFGSLQRLAHVDGRTEYHEWNRFPSQQSDPVSLTAGQGYYIETIHKAAGTNDHIEVAWSGPGLDGTNPIPGSALVPADIDYPPELNTTYYEMPLSTPSGGLVAVLTATDSSLDTLAFGIVSGNESGTFSLEASTGRLLVADRSVLDSRTVTDFYLLIEVQDSGYGGLYPPKSLQSSVTVHVLDDTRPYTWTGRGVSEYWSEAKNWDHPAPVEYAQLDFKGNTRQTNYNDQLVHAGKVTLENGGFFITGNPLALRGGLSNVGTNVWALGTTLLEPLTVACPSGFLTIAAPVNNNGYDLYVTPGSGLQGSDAVVRIEGPISGTGPLDVYGAGRLVLASSNSFSGTTWLSLGTTELQDPHALGLTSDIQLQDSILDARPIGGLTIEPTQTLHGQGTVMGPVQVKGVLGAPDDGPTFGGLIFNGSLTLANATVLRISGFPAPKANTIQVHGTLQLGGSLTVVGSGQFFPNSLPAFGNQFKLFTAASIIGSFTNVSLPDLTWGLVWDTSKLMTEGLIRVTATPPLLSYAASTNGAPAVQFQAWGGINYRLESTPNLASPVAWIPVGVFAGSNSFIQVLSNNVFWFETVPRDVVVPIDQSRPQSFYRLSLY
jgi:hypothetical protein